MARKSLRQTTFLGHPLGLYVLFFTEMWERFSYYGMRALLMLYMVNYFRWSQQDASVIYKVYTSFVYVTPILGGFLADRYLGNTHAVIIGALLMAVGHFLMAFEEYPIFISALIFLVLGNGFFKPNMSTQVGRLYPTNDGRRDGAYTIFYMGINLGAFLAPLVCGWLAENTKGGYHTGFTMAGIGMVLGLVIYLLGQPLIQEIASDESDSSDPSLPSSADAPKRTAKPKAAKPKDAKPKDAKPTGPRPLSEAEAAETPSALGAVAAMAPALLLGIGAATVLLGVLLWQMATLKIWDALMVVIGGGCLVLLADVCRQVRNAVRDRVLAILALGVFVIFFWGAFEQAGNALNLWADKSTNRFLTEEARVPEIIIQVKEDESTSGAEAPAAQKGLGRLLHLFDLKENRAESSSWGAWIASSINPVPTTWFQSINALAIFVLAPLFAWLWVLLDKRGWQPSIPLKMTFGLLLMSASMAVMMAGAQAENRHTNLEFASGAIPELLTVADDGRIGVTDKKGHFEAFHAGRLSWNTSAKSLELWGVLPDTERDRIIAATAPKSFQNLVQKLIEDSKTIDGSNTKEIVVTVENEPAGFDMTRAGLKRSVVDFDAAANTLTVKQPLAEKEQQALLVAAGEPAFRAAVNKLFQESAVFRVSPWWLVWSYLLATLGELCLSPVGLSMVSKLAPAKYATMLMGVWLLTTAFGNFAAGAMGEVWGTIPPIAFFFYATTVVAASALVLFFLVRWITSAMHGVN